jgi:hypothetical protein
VINLNGGGFSQAVKTFNNPIDLSTYVGLLVEIDAQPFAEGVPPLGLHVQLRDTSSYTFAAAFAVPLSDGSAERVKLFVPMSAFDRAGRWGGECSSCQLNTQRVTGLEISVLFQAGPFTVRLREVSAARQYLDVPFVTVPALQLQSAASVGLIQGAISSGAPLYDKGYRELCIAIYTSTIRTLLAASGNSSHTGVACAGLVRAAQGGSTSKAERAWVLRRTLDALGADLMGVPRNADSFYPAVVRDGWLPGAGATSALANACAAWQYIDATGYGGIDHDDIITSSSVMDGALTPSCTSGSAALTDFFGPFEHMGISGHNDFALTTVSGPDECARLCRCEPNCLSFDFGARGSVSGECWRSLANRATAGHAYSRWRMYDYYELKAGGSSVEAASMEGDPLPGADTADEAQSLWSNPLVLSLVGAGIVIAILVGLLLVMMLRLRTRKQQASQGVVPSNTNVVRGSADGVSQDVVVGKPVAEPVVVQVPEDSRQVQRNKATTALPADAMIGA